MKYLNKFFLFIVGLIIPIASCNTDKLHDMNINPQSLNEVDMNYLFTEVELGTASGGSAGDDRYLDWRTGILWCAPLIQQTSMSQGGQYGAGNTYEDNQEVYHAPWRFWYTDVLKNCTEILKQTAEGGFEAGQKKNTREATRIIRAWTYARLTDFYGAIPYTDANKGIEGTFFPTYDKQSTIYPDLLKELDEAATAISSSNADEGFAQADFIYNGDITKWKKWAYSLMLRYAMRVSNVDAAMANTYVAKAVTGGVFTSNADNAIAAQATGPGEWTNQNGISRAFQPGDGDQDDFLSETFIFFLKGANQGSVADDDPRLMVISGGILDWSSDGTPVGLVTPYPGGTLPVNQLGMPNGHDHSELVTIFGFPDTFTDNEKFSRINPLMLYDAAPYMLMNAAEAEFLQAEACERGIGGLTASGAQAHYDAGVKDAMQMYTIYDPTLIVTDAQVAAYLVTYPYGDGAIISASNPTGAGSKLAQIGQQLWACHFFNWYEAWNDWRRTGFPDLVPTTYVSSLTNGVIPTKLRYPTDEVAGNPNYKTGATLPNDLTVKVWWDGGTE